MMMMMWRLCWKIERNTRHTTHIGRIGAANTAHDKDAHMCQVSARMHDAVQSRVRSINGHVESALFLIGPLAHMCFRNRQQHREHGGICLVSFINDHSQYRNAKKKTNVYTMQSSTALVYLDDH